MYFQDSFDFIEISFFVIYFLFVEHGVQKEGGEPNTCGLMGNNSINFDDII